MTSSRGRRRNGEQNMPLLVGLADTSAARRSLETPLSATGPDTAEDGYLDLEELARKRTAGGNMFDSVANMANSILGAGMLPCLLMNTAWMLTLYLGIIGLPSAFVSSSPSHEIRRSPLCRQSSRLLHRNHIIGCSMCHNRLDDTSDRRQCETQWPKFLHRDYEPLLWFQRTSSRLIFPVFIRFRRSVSVVQRSAIRSLTVSPRHVRLWYYYWWVISSLTCMILMFRCRRHDTPRHSLGFPNAPYHTHPILVHEASIRNCFLHYLHLLSPFAIS